MLNKIITSKIWETLESRGFGIIVINNSREIVKMSKPMEREFGLEPNQSLRKSIFYFFREDIFNKENIRQSNGNLWREVKLCVANKKNINWAMAQLPLSFDNKVCGTALFFEKIPSYDKEVILPSEQPIKLIGTSPSFLHILNSANLVAKTNSTVLLRGESGTGKGLMAKYIHSLSYRRKKALISINCAAIPPTLLESELFGYVEGAFTGAKKGGKIGLVEAADQGTVVLDEVTELSPFMQVKLLRFLQEGTIRRIGDIEEKKLDVRVIATTNRDIEKMVGRGEFREDLYYRLNVFPIFIPPLRERREDIPLLARHFIAKLNPKLHMRIKSISNEAMQKLQEYSWPGNIRELEYLLERAMLMAKGDQIQVKDLIIDSFRNIEYTKYKQLYLQKRYSLKQILDVAEENIIREALKENHSIRMAARALGISHPALIAKMKKFKITSHISTGSKQI